MHYRTNPDGSVTEIPPERLDCGHPYRPRGVTVGFGSPQGDDGHRVRWYRCNECRQVTYDDGR